MRTELKEVLSNLAADKEKVKSLFADFDYLKRRTAEDMARRRGGESDAPHPMARRGDQTLTGVVPARTIPLL